jgi:hypothetical protein
MLNFKQFIAAIKEGTHDFMTDTQLLNHVADHRYSDRGSKHTKARLAGMWNRIADRFESIPPEEIRNRAIKRRKAELDQKNK